MSRSVIAAAVAGLVVLAGCGSPTQPSAPPPSEDALTTATTEPDVVEETTEAEVTSEEPEETSAGGPPEMPAEAKEQTEEGAEAFVQHYIDVVNYTGMHPQTGLLEPLAGEGCKSCENHEESVSYGEETGDYLPGPTFVSEPGDVLLTETGARIATPVEQPAQVYLNDGKETDRELEQATATLVFRLRWSDGWSVSEITVET